MRWFRRFSASARFLNGSACSAPEVGHVAQREDQVVVLEDVVARQEARRERDRLRREVDLLNLADVHVGARQEMRERAHHVGEPDAAGHDLREHRLEDEVVLAIHERDLHVLVLAEQLLQSLRGVDAAETAAQHDDVLAVLADVDDVEITATPSHERQQEDAHDQRRNRGCDVVN